MRRVLMAVAATVLLAAGLATAHRVVASSGIPPGHIGICHHTGQSRAHEWIYITPAAAGVLNGHGQARHNFEEDIIPPFVLVKQHGTVRFPGLNLDERIGVDLEPDPNGPYTGAEILAAGCAAPGSTGGTTDTGTTQTVTTGTTVTVTTGTTQTVTVTQPSTTTITVPGHRGPRFCTAISVRPRQLFVGQRTNLRITVTRHGHRVAGVRVRIRGRHINRITRWSNHRGIIRSHVLLRQPGVLHFRPIVFKSCGAKSVGVTGVFTPPVTG